MRPPVETNSGLSAVLRGVVADMQHASGADIGSMFLYEEATHTYYAPFATGQPQESLLDSLADMREQLARYLNDAEQGKVPDELGVPGPVEVLLRIWQLAASGELFRDSAVTFSEAALGMMLGGTMGAALPFALRLSPRLLAALDPLISAGFGLPKLALAPLFILWFGIGIPTKVVFVASIV